MNVEETKMTDQASISLPMSYCGISEQSSIFFSRLYHLVE